MQFRCGMDKTTVLIKWDFSNFDNARSGISMTGFFCHSADYPSAHRLLSGFLEHFLARASASIKSGWFP